MFNKTDIESVLPHRAPFLFLDEAEIVNETDVTGYFTFKEDMPVFKGHFPGNPVVPGVLIIEALCQAGAFGLLSRPQFNGKNALLIAVNNAKFKAMVKPNDKLTLKVRQTAYKMTIAACEAEAYIGEKLAARCEISCAIVDK